jgi:hypothetical protein
VFLALIAKFARTVALCFLFAAVVLPAAGRQSAAIALVGARVLPVSGPPVERGTVLIAGEKITAVGRDVPIPAGAQRIDLRGRVIIPGLVDARSSLFVPESERGGTGAADRSVLDAADFFSRDADQVLAHGVTTLYLSAGSRGNVRRPAVAPPTTTTHFAGTRPNDPTTRQTPPRRRPGGAAGGAAGRTRRPC